MAKIRIHREGRQKRPFTHLHLHTEYSILDGCGKLGDFVNKVKKRRMNAVCMTEHGTMRGVYAQHLACGEAEVQPIYGIEFYMAGTDMTQKGLTDEQKEMATSGIVLKRDQKDAIKRMERKLGIRDRFHVCAYAMNQTGMRNLFILSSLGWLEGYYYRPRIDLPSLIKYNEGIIVTTGCASGIIPSYIIKGDYKTAVETAEILYEAFGDRLYAEIQPIDYDEQVLVNKGVLAIAKAMGLPLLATNDAHYIDESDQRNHEIILCLSTRDVMSNPNRWKFDANGLWVKNRREMEESFARWHPYIRKKQVRESLDNTEVVRERCQEARIEVDRFKCLLPSVEIPEEDWGEFSKWRNRKLGVDTTSDVLVAAGGELEDA